jgi:hypothetical protein
MPFDDHIKEILINKLKSLPPVVEGADKDDVEIAVTSFGYRNQKMI